MSRNFAERGVFDTEIVALNNRGQLAITRFDRGRDFNSAYRWTDGVDLPLGHLGDYPPESWAEAINDAGDVVGASAKGGYDSPYLTHAFLYRDSTGIVDLNTRIASGSGWELSAASGINNRGQIVGTGNKGGFHLTPIRPLPGFLRP